MNRLKWKTPKGLIVTAKVQQNPPRYGLRGEPWKSPAQVKARILRMGYQLAGVRQVGV